MTISGNTPVSGLSACGHNIVVYATDTNGNTMASNTVFFTLHPSDITGDAEVDIFDLQRIWHGRGDQNAEIPTGTKMQT